VRRRRGRFLSDPIFAEDTNPSQFLVTVLCALPNRLRCDRQLHGYGAVKEKEAQEKRKNGKGEYM
jgi:hypothetical protein